MLIRRRIFLAVSLMGLTLLCQAGFSAGPPPMPPSPQDSDFTMEGKITDQSPGKLTINSGDNIIFHVIYSNKTGIKKKDGSAGTAQDLHVGLKISVAGSLGETGEIAAKRIEIDGEGSEKN